MEGFCFKMHPLPVMLFRGQVFLDWGGSGRHLDVNYSLWPDDSVSRQKEAEREGRGR